MLSKKTCFVSYWKMFERVAAMATPLPRRMATHTYVVFCTCVNSLFLNLLWREAVSFVAVNRNTTCMSNFYYEYYWVQATMSISEYIYCLSEISARKPFVSIKYIKYYVSLAAVVDPFLVILAKAMAHEPPSLPTTATQNVLIPSSVPVPKTTHARRQPQKLSLIKTEEIWKFWNKEKYPNICTDYFQTEK